jgi:hypothetical protein
VVDLKFASWYEATRGEPERWTAEHLANGVPTVDELTAAFHPTTLHGLANTTIWMDSMRVQFGPPGWLRRVRFAVAYVAHIGADQRAPFKGCLITVEHRSQATPGNA